MHTSQPPRLSRMLFMPPPSLRGLVRYFHYEHATGGRVLLRATPNPMVTFFLSGGSYADHPDGTRTNFQLPFACGPATAAFHATWLPGTSFITAICEPATFGELLGLDILELGEQPLALEIIAPHLSAQGLAEALCRTGSASDAVDLFSTWLLELAGAREAAIRSAFQVAGDLLFTPSLDIAAQLGLGLRQVERKHLAAYGLSLRERRKMTRYTNALGLLIRHAGQRGMLTRIAAAAGYFDQAHMIRDFKAFMGMAPGAVVAAPGADTQDVMRLLRYDGAEASIITR